MDKVEVVTLSTNQLEDMFRRAFIFARSQEKQIFTKTELAKFLITSEATINRWMKKGLPRIGGGRPRFEKNAVLAWLENNPDL
jgi:hypothetical protein